MLEVARDLIGCVVAHGDAAGVIVETEAYHDSEPACHAFVGLTPRTATLFGPPGRAYVYRSYGIHALLNAVCEPEGVGAGGADPRARAARRDRADARAARASSALEDLCSGPGKLTQALGVELEHNGTTSLRGPVVIGRRRRRWRAAEVVVGTRIGITQGGRAAVALLRGRQPRTCRGRGRRACARGQPRRRADAAGLRAAGAAVVRPRACGRRRRGSPRAPRCRRRRRVPAVASPPPPPFAAAAASVPPLPRAPSRRRAGRRRGVAVAGAAGRPARRALAGIASSSAPSCRRAWPVGSASAACRSPRLDMKSCQIIAGIGAAGDRLAAELGRHRLEPVRVADPDGDRDCVVQPTNQASP